MASVWQNNKMLRKWEEKNFKKIANGDFNYNLAYPLEDPLIKAISKYLNIKKEYIYVGAGSSQFISAVVGLKCWNKIFLSDIEFSLYKRSATLNEKDVNYISGITTKEFLLNLKKQKSSKNDLLCISSPRWFSGEMFSKKQIQDILNIFKGTLIIDEAYVDYSDDEQGMLKLCLSNDRILLFRTFSKKFLACKVFVANCRERAMMESDQFRQRSYRHAERHHAGLPAPARPGDCRAVRAEL